MSKNIEGLVETSKNLWLLRLKQGKIKIVYMIRSSSTLKLSETKNDIKRVLEKNAFDVKIWNSYPWWEEDVKWELVQRIIKNYKKCYKKEVKIMAVHAGLECWIILEKLWKWAQAVSIGPTILWAHTVEERCNIQSVEIIAEVIKKYLED
jgi:dipeptidase D